MKNHEYLSASRKNVVDESFFNIIDTEFKAYWLGFLYADGYVCKRKDENGKEKGGYIELTLQSRDGYHIQNFLHDIKSSATISDKKVKLNGNEYSAKRTCIGSIKMVNDLIKHGCVENKSLILTPPTTVPKDLLCHFIRGYFDGDGCVCFYPQSYHYTYNILGTKEFLTFIVKETKISSYNITSFSHKKCYSLDIYSKKSIEIFHNYIYKNKSIYLERKYQKSLAMMKWCGMKDSRNETQRLADLIDTKLFFNDECLDNFTCISYKLNNSETAALADLLD